MYPKPYTGQISAEDSMTFNQKNSFHSKYNTVLLPAVFQLWRFVSKKKDGRFGCFWTDQQTMQTIMQTLHHNNNFTPAFKKENIRDSLAILEEWSKVNWRLKIRLTREVIAYTGITGTQKLFKEELNNLSFGGAAQMHKAIETRIGRQLQYVIPGFRHLQDNNSFGRIELLVHI